MLSDDARRIDAPVVVSPVNEILLTRGSLTSASPTIATGTGQHRDAALGHAGLDEQLAEHQRGDRA